MATLTSREELHGDAERLHNEAAHHMRRQKFPKYAPYPTIPRSGEGSQFGLTTEPIEATCAGGSAHAGPRSRRRPPDYGTHGRSAMPAKKRLMSGLYTAGSPTSCP
jgi:hypothetical protein